MPEASYYPPGTFCMVDLTTDDQDKARAYYEAVFGWDAQDIKNGQTGQYFSLMKSRDLTAAVIAPRPPMLPPGSSWNSYVRVENAAAAAARAKELGATILAGAGDVGDAGKLAILQSPTGERFMVWEPRARPGAAIVDEAGAFAWTELYTRDGKESCKFYTKLFGWTYTTDSSAGIAEYTTFANKGRGIAGMIEITADMKGMEPVWSVYFAVDDSNRATRDAKEAGGRVIVDEISNLDVGQFAMFADPVAASYFAIQLAQEPEPLPTRPA